MHSDTPTTSPISLGTLTGTSDASVLAPNCPYYLLYPLVPEEAEWQYAFPFWIELSAQEVNADERLRLKIEVWGRNWHKLGYRPNTLYLIAAANSDDLYVDLPLV